MSRAKCFTIDVFPEDVGPSNKIARFEIKPLKIDLMFFSSWGVMRKSEEFTFSCE